MATPHIVGLAAYLLAYEGIATSDLCTRIVELSQKGVITGLPASTPNNLAFNGAQVNSTLAARNYRSY
jgi:hypothetical protein